MINKEEFEYFADQLLENAERDFNRTEQYKLLNEKLERMEKDCDYMFTEDQKEFAFECFELLEEVHMEEEDFIYRRGLKDCVSLLKWLEVLT